MAPLAADAKRDATEIAEHYRREAGREVAQRFSAALRAALGNLREHPEIGSPRFAALTGLVGLRAWPIIGFPYLIFYRTLGDEVFILRIPHTARDVPARLHGTRSIP